MRTKYSLINMAVSFAAQFINIILLFISRRVFIRYFAVEYLGVNGLFTNILTVLSLAELGIGTAMMYGLYSPVAEENEGAVCRLMNLYKRLYAFVGAAVFLIGLCLFPFLDILIKGEQIPHIRLVYLMYLTDSVVSYFFSYKQAIIQAHQKGFVISAVSQGVRCAQILAQMAVIVLVRNFYLYLGIQIAAQIGTNLVLARIADRQYPYLRKNTFGLPDREERNAISAHIRAMALHRFGGVLVMHTDNLIISAFIGLASLGVYSNYKMVLNSLKLFVSYVYNAFAAGIGNLAATESREKVLEVYRSLNFFMSLLYGWIAVCLFVLFTPFIRFMFGEAFVLPVPVMAVIVLDFYLHGMRQMTLRFRDGMGLYRHDRYKPIPEVLINLVSSIVLAGPFGIAGVTAGTIISTMATNFWVEPLILFKYGIRIQWKKNLCIYFGNYMEYAAFALGAGWLCLRLTRLIDPTGLAAILGTGILCTVLYGGLALIVFGRSREWRYLWKRLARQFGRKEP